MSTFNGKIASTPIIVDNFQPPYSAHSVRFLSHLHTDHIKGLSVDYPGVIYCSEITKVLLIHKFNFVASKIETLEENVAKGVNIKWENFDDNENENRSGNFHFIVTAFPANHCPGSLMFYFEGEFGSALCTGDFRYSPEMKENSVFSQRVVGNVDTLFLDTTFVDPLWMFPTRIESIQLILDLIRKFDKKNSHEKGDVYLECEMLGTEFVLVQLALEFDSQVYVDETKFKEYEKYLPNPHKYFTTKQSSTRFYGCRHKTFTTLGNNISPSKLPKKPIGSRKPLANQQPKNERPYLCIKPSAQWFSHQDRVLLKHCLKAPYKAMDGVWHVLFSIHSSFGELEEFVKWVHPKSITPTVTPCHRVGLLRLQSYTIGNKTESKVLEEIVRGEAAKVGEKRKISLDGDEQNALSKSSIHEEDMDSFYSTLLFSSTLSTEEVVDTNSINSSIENSIETESFESTTTLTTYTNEPLTITNCSNEEEHSTVNKIEINKNNESEPVSSPITTEIDRNANEAENDIFESILEESKPTEPEQQEKEQKEQQQKDSSTVAPTPPKSKPSLPKTPKLQTPQKPETKQKATLIAKNPGTKKAPRLSEDDEDDFLKILSKSKLRCPPKQNG
eukprot:TRINITY_DN5181_c0_g2_i1.p1 TRINITY_DN5181_c0_g2~~TRINITY_DN5181_c0_g2_i1.p1  ORF type:complete len:616 (-),score=126.24 TRINITY_DN5181_c0_g2_i1:852-2699(-)